MVNIFKYTPKQLAELAFTEEELAQLARAREMPFVYDEDCPPVTSEQAKLFRRAHPRKAHEELTAYLETENDDQCLEYDSTHSYSDSEAANMLAALTGNSNPQYLQSFDQKLRDIILRKLKDQGLTVRQISRLTGINRNTVQRA